MSKTDIPYWRDVRRQRLIDAARDVFTGSSYAQASMDRIAATAAVGKPTLYRYFATKDQLFAAVVANAFERLERDLAAVPTDHGPAERLAALVALIADTLGRHFGALGALGDDAAQADVARRQAFQAYRARIGKPLRDTIARGIEAGVFQPVDPDLIAMTMLGGLRAAAITGVAGQPAAIGAIINFYLSGLGHRPAG